MAHPFQKVAERRLKLGCERVPGVAEGCEIGGRRAGLGQGLVPLVRAPEVRPPQDTAALAGEDQRVGLSAAEVAEMSPLIRDDRMGVPQREGRCVTSVE